MAISTNSIITWADLTTKCYNAIINTCCNIDSFKNVPTRLQNGNGYLAVRSITVGISGSKSTQTFTWYGNGSNLVTIVASSTVSSEWNNFLSAAGINAHSNKVIQAKELGLAIGLYQQFLSYHLKPIYSRRQIYNTVEAQSTFSGTRYVTGTCTPKYTLTGIDPSSIPEVTNDEIRSMIRQNLFHDGTNYGMIDYENNPSVTRTTLS